MKLGVIRYKIWHDLWANRGRTLRVVLIIAIGAFAVGTIFGGAEFMTKDVARTWQASAPATIGLFVEPPISESTVDTLANVAGVEAIEGRFQATIQWRAGPSDPWQPALLVAVDDYQQQSLRTVSLVEGSWPERKMIGVQRGYGLAVGQQVYLEIGDREQAVTLNGTLYDPAHPPPFAMAQVMFFTTRQRFTELTGQPNRSLVLATIPVYTEAEAGAVADRLQHELEKQDIEVSPALAKPGGFKTRINHPDRFISQDVLDGMIMIMQILALTTLVLGLFLVYNTVNAVLVEQVNQIGVMKAIGANSWQILLVYFSLVLVYATLALVVAVPLAALAAHGMRLALVSRFNMVPGPFEISTTALAVQVVVALMAPPLAALIPILAGASITVREAISTYGLEGASGPLSRLLVRLQFLPRLATLTISNTFRNQKRVLLTEITLTGAGVIFMMVMNIQASITYTFEEVIFSIFEVNILLDLEEPARLGEIEQITYSHPNVESVEVWGLGQGTARPAERPENNEDPVIRLRGVPVPSQAYSPQLQAGRSLLSEDDYAIVLNQELAEELGVGVGDWITVDIPTRRESEWRVVGLIFEPMDQQAALVPREALARELRQVGQGTAIRAGTVEQSAAAEATTVEELRAFYRRQGYEVQASTQDTSHRLVEEWLGRMSIIIVLLSVMAGLVSIAGAVALSGTLAINVVERTREIGVMRAIGASSTAVIGQFVGEGLILGWLSWLMAIPFSLPVGLLMVNTLGRLINIDLVYRVSGTGMLYWLLLVTVLAAVASWLPAQKAAQTSVRESLAYI